MSLEQQIANEHPNALNLLGMDRMIRRAYEAATSDNPSMTKVWHDAEVLAAERRSEKSENIAAAARNLIAQKGRHNTEIAYKRVEDVIAKDRT